ncbi:MAG: ATP-grasp domain-containing protein [Microcoleaceae cyanobacterium]
MRVIYPENPLHRTQADGPYHDEFMAVSAFGHQCSLFDFDGLMFGEFNPRPGFQVGERVLYRGWMLNSQSYKTLIAQINRKGGVPATSPAAYILCHHLPGWYQHCSDFTAETCFFDVDEKLETKIEELGWGCYFVKDFVKSNTAEQGSIAHSPSEVLSIVEQIAKYRGEIEGGIAIRRVESYRSNTEQRYFVVRGCPYSPDAEIPGLVKEIAKLIKSPFYSVDIIENSVGELRLVELGDGQVSDKKTWPLSKFVEVITANA